jgi:hypothetical protein
LIKPRKARIDDVVSCQPMVQTFIGDRPIAPCHCGKCATAIEPLAYPIATIHRDPGVLEIADWAGRAKAAIRPQTRIGLASETGATINAPSPRSATQRPKGRKARQRAAKQRDRAARLARALAREQK